MASGATTVRSSPVDDLTFAVQPGQVLGVLGPNGAGKTTAIRVLTTILAPPLAEDVPGELCRAHARVIREQSGQAA